MRKTIQIDIHTIDEIPEISPNNNPFVGLFSETSLAPKIILIQDYKKYVKNWAEESVFDDSLIGWIYMGDLMPNDARLELTHLAAINNYYNDLKL